MQEAHNVIIVDSMPVEESTEHSVLFSDPPGGVLNLRRGLDPLELVGTNPVLEFEQMLSPPSSRSSLIVSNTFKVLCLKKKILSLGTRVDEKGRARVGHTYVLR